MGTRLAAEASDNFNRAGPALGANWAGLVDTLVGAITISASTVFVGVASDADSAARWVGAGNFGNDHWSSAVFAETDFGATGYAIGVIARASADTDANRDYYFHRANSNDTSEFGKTINGAETIFNSGAVTWSDGDRVEIEVEGTTIRACKNGVPIGGAFTVTDSALSTGLPGILAQGDSAVATGDDWEAGNFVIPLPSTRSRGTQPLASAFEDDGRFNELDIRNWW